MHISAHTHTHRHTHLLLLPAWVLELIEQRAFAQHSACGITSGVMCHHLFSD